MLPEYELTVGAGNIVVLTCSECGCEFTEMRWQFEVDIEEEGDDYEPFCLSCRGLEDLP